MKNGSELTTAGAVEPGGGNIVINATKNVRIDHSRIDVSGGGDASPFRNPGGDAGNISITAGEAVRLNQAQILAEGAPSGPRAPGNGGNIVIDAGKTFVSQGSTVSAHSDNLTGGNIMIQSLEQLRLEEGLISTAGGHGGAVTMQAGKFVLDSTRVAANGVEGGGKIAIEATDSVVIRNSPLALDVSGSSPIPIPAPGGEVTIKANRVIINDSGINANASTLGLLPDPAAIYFDTGVRPGREGNRNPNLTPAEAFQTQDGYLTVVLLNPDQWTRFCEGLGDPALATDPRFATNADRLANHPDLKARIEPRLATASTAEWARRFEAVNVAAGPIYEFDEVFEDPQVRHLGLVAEVQQPGLGPVRMLACPFGASATPPAIRRPAPRLGEHTAEVLAEMGVASEAIDRLAAAGVIALGPAGDRG